jgi:hypothetical protein
MIKIKIHNGEIENLSNASIYNFPKYTTQIVNLVNSNAGGTRPKVVGQMSDLINEFPGQTLQEWINWYNTKNPNAIKEATEKIWDKFLEMKGAVEKIDKKLIEEWVKDLVYTKTYCGLKFQAAIIAFIANKLGKSWRLSNPTEEAKGIDGFVGKIAVQIKSSTYKLEKSRGEVINCPIIYYDKKKDGLNIEYNENEIY